MAIEIVSFPIKNGGSFHCYVSSPEGKHRVLAEILAERNSAWDSHWGVASDVWNGPCCRLGIIGHPFSSARCWDWTPVPSGADLGWEWFGTPVMHLPVSSGPYAYENPALPRRAASFASGSSPLRWPCKCIPSSTACSTSTPTSCSRSFPSPWRPPLRAPAKPLSMEHCSARWPTSTVKIWRIQHIQIASMKIRSGDTTAAATWDFPVGLAVSTCKMLTTWAKGDMSVPF